MSAHELLGGWESYYVILGTSAAALTGLQFVVIALVADTPEIKSEESIGAFGTPTVVHFCLSLFVAAVVSAPWHGFEPLLWLLLATGIAGVAYTFLVLRRARHQKTYRPVGEDWLWHAILPFVAYGTLIGGALSFARDPTTALFLVGGVALMLVFIGIHNAWDAVAYIAIQVHSKTNNKGA